MKSKILLLFVLTIGVLSSAFAVGKTDNVVPNGTCVCKIKISPGHYPWHSWKWGDRTLSFSVYKKAICAMNGTKLFPHCTDREFERLPPKLILKVPCGGVAPAAAPTQGNTVGMVTQQAVDEMKTQFLTQMGNMKLVNEKLQTQVANAEQKVKSLQLQVALKEANSEAVAAKLSATTKDLVGLRRAQKLFFVALVFSAVVVLSLFWVWRTARRKYEDLNALYKTRSSVAADNAKELANCQISLGVALARADGLSRELEKAKRDTEEYLDELLRSIRTKKWPFYIKGMKFELDIAGYDEDGPIITFPGCPDFPEVVPLKEVKRGLLVCYKTMFKDTGITYEDILHLPELA